MNLGFRVFMLRGLSAIVNIKECSRYVHTCDITCVYSIPTHIRSQKEDGKRQVRVPVQSTGHVKLSDKIMPQHWNCAIGWWSQGQPNKLCLVRALSSGPENPPNQTFELSL